MNDEKLKRTFLLWHLLSIEGVGPQKLLNLTKNFKTLNDLLDTNLYSLLNVSGIYRQLAEKILIANKNMQRQKEIFLHEIDELEKIGGRIINFWDDEYPYLLKNTYLPPIILYTIGKIEQIDSNPLAIVGTRQPSSYGKKNAKIISTGISQKGITIVSGMARGIDSIAHNSALENGGRTIAVIGSGLDIVYPPENKRLFERISESGAIISEFPLGTKPDAQNFPRRNRIISGMSLGTIVIESRENGGALQTARLAFDQNRDVFALPGNIDSPQSSGTNRLIIRNQAKAFTNIEDILIEYPGKFDNGERAQKKLDNIKLNMFEEKVYSILSTKPKHIDQISIEANLNVSECSNNLLTLELQGLVTQLPGKYFIST